MNHHTVYIYKSFIANCDQHIQLHYDLELHIRTDIASTFVGLFIWSFTNSLWYLLKGSRKTERNNNLKEGNR